MVLEDYLHISLVRRQNGFPLFKLQMNLLEDLVLTEKAISAYKQERKERQEKLSGGVADKGQLEDEIRGIERELHLHEAQSRAIRDIADGIAWRLFDYDRAILCEMANRPGNKHINLQGIEAELHEFGQVFNSKEGLAILNDLTHFLKLGDVTIRKDTGTFEIVEVKKGHKTSGRITRQKQDLRRTIAFFNTGKRDDEEGQIIISELDLVPDTYHTNVRTIIERAEKTGTAVERIGDHLIIQCTDFLKANDLGLEAAEAILPSAFDWADDWRKKGDLVLDFLSQEKYLNVRNYAPFSVFPLPETARVKLMTGAMWLIVFVNVSAVLRYIVDRGWKLVMAPHDYMEEYKKSGTLGTGFAAKLSQGPLSTQVPWVWFGRLGFEFLKPRTLAEMLEAILAGGPTEGTLSFVNLSGEPRIWD